MHTPGPYLRSGPLVYALQGEGAAATNRFTADVYPGFTANGERTPLSELEAVATLFQAAPDLLAACEAAREALQRAVDNFRGEAQKPFLAALATVEAAISKARG